MVFTSTLPFSSHPLPFCCSLENIQNSKESCLKYDILTILQEKDKTKCNTSEVHKTNEDNNAVKKKTQKQRPTRSSTQGSHKKN